MAFLYHFHVMGVLIVSFANLLLVFIVFNIFHIQNPIAHWG